MYLPLADNFVFSAFKKNFVLYQVGILIAIFRFYNVALPYAPDADVGFGGRF